MMALHLEAALFHRQYHLGAQVLVMIGGRNWKIAFLVTRTVSEIVFLASGVPASFFRVDEIKAVILFLVEADVVEDEELGFGPEVRSIGQSGGGQEHLRLLCDVTRIAV